MLKVRINQMPIDECTSGLGLHNRTTGSIPLVANIHVDGWGCRQLTMDSSPRKTRTMLVVAFSQIKNEPSSEPATIYWPLLWNWYIILSGIEQNPELYNTNFKKRQHMEYMHNNISNKNYHYCKYNIVPSTQSAENNN